MEGKPSKRKGTLDVPAEFAIPRKGGACVYPCFGTAYGSQADACEAESFSRIEVNMLHIKF